MQRFIKSGLNGDVNISHEASKYFTERTTGGARWFAYNRTAHLHNQVAATAAALEQHRSSQTKEQRRPDAPRRHHKNSNFLSLSLSLSLCLIHFNSGRFNSIAIPLSFHFEKNWWWNVGDAHHDSDFPSLSGTLMKSVILTFRYVVTSPPPVITSEIKPWNHDSTA